MDPDSNEDHDRAESPFPKVASHRFATSFWEALFMWFLRPAIPFAGGVLFFASNPWVLRSGQQARWYEHPLVLAWMVTLSIVVVLPCVTIGLIRFTKTLEIEISKQTIKITEQTILRRKECAFDLMAKPATQFHRPNNGHWFIEILLPLPFRFGHGFAKQLYDVFEIVETAVGRDPADGLTVFRPPAPRHPDRESPSI